MVAHIIIKKNWLQLAVLLFSILCTVSGNTAQTGDTRYIDFTGRLRNLTPCGISHDNVMTVDFGRVGINQVASGKYILPLEYSLECSGSALDQTLSMSFNTSMPIASDPSAMSTSVEGLWVRILKDGQPLTLNRYFTISNPTALPKLEVQLISDPQATLKVSAFTAVATLVAEYL